MILEAVLLGLSTGTYCTMYCAPVLIPFLCGCDKTGYKRNAGLIGSFLGARLITYFVLGAVFAALGLLVNEYMDPVFARKLSVYAYIFSDLALLCNSLGIKFPWGCGEEGCKVPKLRKLGNDWITAIVAGLAVGLHVCRSSCLSAPVDCYAPFNFWRKRNYRAFLFCIFLYWNFAVFYSAVWYSICNKKNGGN